MKNANKQTEEIILRPFERHDFTRLISWLPTEAAHVEWCAAFFRFPLDETQLEQYLESSKQPNGRAVFVGETSSGEAVGHVEISHIWPHLSSRLSRVLVAPAKRHCGIGTSMIAQALTFSFRTHHLARIDLGVSQDNRAAIACYAKLGFEHVGTWTAAMMANKKLIDVYWMTITKENWAAHSSC